MPLEIVVANIDLTPPLNLDQQLRIYLIRNFTIIKGILQDHENRIAALELSAAALTTANDDNANDIDAIQDILTPGSGVNGSLLTLTIENGIIVNIT